MAVKRCLKCGAEITEDAQFCPSCGAPKGTDAIREEAMEPAATPQPGQQNPPPAYQQPPQYQQPMKPQTPLSMQKVSPLAGIFDMAFSKTGIIMGVAIGVLLAWIGVLIGVFSTRNIDVAMFMSATGFAIIGFQLAAGGLWNKKIIQYARLGMVLIGGYIIINGVSIAAAMLQFRF